MCLSKEIYNLVDEVIFKYDSWNEKDLIENGYAGIEDDFKILTT